MTTVSRLNLRLPLMAAITLHAAGIFPGLAGEKAAISVPSKPTASPNSVAPSPAPTPFESLNRNSSIGGVVDTPAAPVQIPLPVPDARTQKEMIERLDRRKNWLLDDGSRTGRTPGEALILEAGSDPDYSTNPRRPQTTLERKLRSGSRNAPSDAADRESARPSDADNAADDLLKPAASDPFSPPLRTSSGLNPIWRQDSSRLQQTGAISAGDSLNFQDLRTTSASVAGKASGLDSLAQERLERYQRSFGGEGAPERTSSLGASVDNARSRESRTDFMDSVQRSGGATRPGSTGLSGLARDDSSAGPALARSALASGSGLNPPVNPYAAPPSAPEPYVSPGAKMLRAPAQELPRFRP